MMMKMKRRMETMSKVGITQLAWRGRISVDNTAGLSIIVGFSYIYTEGSLMTAALVR